MKKFIFFLLILISLCIFSCDENSVKNKLNETGLEIVDEEKEPVEISLIEEFNTSKGVTVIYTEPTKKMYKAIPQFSYRSGKTVIGTQETYKEYIEGDKLILAQGMWQIFIAACDDNNKVLYEGNKIVSIDTASVKNKITIPVIYISDHNYGKVKLELSTKIGQEGIIDHFEDYMINDSYTVNFTIDYEGPIGTVYNSRSRTIYAEKTSDKITTKTLDDKIEYYFNDTVEINDLRPGNYIFTIGFPRKVKSSPQFNSLKYTIPVIVKADLEVIILANIEDCIKIITICLELPNTGYVYFPVLAGDKGFLTHEEFSYAFTGNNNPIFLNIKENYLNNRKYSDFYQGFIDKKTGAIFADIPKFYDGQILVANPRGHYITVDATAEGTYFYQNGEKKFITEPSSSWVKYGEESPLTREIFRDGYILTSWDPPIMTELRPLRNDPEMLNGMWWWGKGSDCDVTVKPVWTYDVDRYLVTFDYNYDGPQNKLKSNTISSKWVRYNDLYGELPEPYIDSYGGFPQGYEGYVFAGWVIED